MRFLVLAHLEDGAALRCAAVLRRMYGSEAVQVVSAEALSMAKCWLHRMEIAQEGRSSAQLNIQTEITLAGGQSLFSGSDQVVLNRLRWAELPHFASASPTDRDYASAEMSALWVSWLASLHNQGIPVINPPQRGALQPATNPVEWIKWAAEAGLPVNSIRIRSKEGPFNATTGPEQLNLSVTVLSAGNRLAIVSPVSDDAMAELHVWLEEMAIRITALKNRTACSLLELTLRQTKGEAATVQPGWRISGINPFPVIQTGPAIEAMVQMLAEAGG